MMMVYLKGRCLKICVFWLVGWVGGSQNETQTKQEMRQKKKVIEKKKRK